MRRPRWLRQLSLPRARPASQHEHRCGAPTLLPRARATRTPGGTGRDSRREMGRSLRSQLSARRARRRGTPRVKRRSRVTRLSPLLTHGVAQKSQRGAHRKRRHRTGRARLSWIAGRERTQGSRMRLQSTRRPACPQRTRISSGGYGSRADSSASVATRIANQPVVTLLRREWPAAEESVHSKYVGGEELGLESQIVIRPAELEVGSPRRRRRRRHFLLLGSREMRELRPRAQPSSADTTPTASGPGMSHTDLEPE